MSKYRYPSELKLNDNLYLIDTCVWIDIAVQISLLFKYKSYRKQSGITNPSVEVILNRIFKDKSNYKIYVSKDIKREYFDVFSRGKENLKDVSKDIQDIVFDYMKSLDEDDTYLISSNKYLLKRDIKKKEEINTENNTYTNNSDNNTDTEKNKKGDPYKGDRRIFVSGRSRYIGNIVTQDWDDYKAVRKDLLDKYNPIIYRCIMDRVGIFNGLELKGGKLTQPRKIKEYFKPLARKFLEYLEKLFD